MTTAVIETNLPGIPLLRRGKVRDVYDLDDRLLIVASDRVSAFDVIMPTPIPGKGKILTGISSFWFEKTKAIIENHVVSTDVAAFPAALQTHADQLEGRSTLAWRADVIPIECVVRGCLAGSGWKEYRQSQTVCGISLPSGLAESSKLPEPIFTPATKAESGHDQNISHAEMFSIIGEDLGSRVMEVSLQLYSFAAAYAAERGIIIADTKFEFGIREGQLLLVDEALTPDSSRFWDAAIYTPGQSQDSIDKQYVRDYLETLDWRKEPPGPELPPEIVANTLRKYREAYERITGAPPLL